MKKINKIKIKLNGKGKLVDNNYFIIHSAFIYDEKSKKNKN